MKSNMISVVTAVSVGLALGLLTLLGFFMYLNRRQENREVSAKKTTTTTTK